jgi:methyl-accepting chemotaxis protein
MDQATQQNAALVEQMAAAAGSLQRPGARSWCSAVAVFKLSSDASSQRPSAAPALQRLPRPAA